MTDGSRFETVHDVLSYWSEQRPEHSALKWPGGTLSYRELKARSEKVAGCVRASGADANHPVAYIGANSPAVFIGWFAASLAGSPFAALNWRSPSAELAAVIADLGPAVVIVDQHHLEALTASLDGLAISPVVIAFDPRDPLSSLDEWQCEPHPLPQVEPKMISLVAYTSGTTGTPKGVAMSHTAFVGIPRSNGGPVAMDWNADDRVIMAMPNFHLGGSFISLRALSAGGTVVILPAFEPKALIDTIVRERATILPLVPTALSLLLESPALAAADVDSVREIVYFGSSIGSETVKRALGRFGCDMMQYYGATETWVMTMLDGPSHDPARPDRLASCGLPIRGVKIRLVDPRGCDVPQGEVGEVVVRSTTMFTGYWKNNSATEAAFAAGWYRTGDLAKQSSDGFFTLVDRAKDMIISGGENVYSAEVERALQSCYGVAMCAVIGVPDERWGEKVEAYVTLTPETKLSGEEIRAECRTYIADYKVPKAVHVMESLPLTASGKVHKPSLRSLATHS